MREWLVAMLVLVATSGCRRSAAPTDHSQDSAVRVGVVDINKVAHEFGWDVTVKDNVTTLRGKLSDQVTQATLAYDAAIRKIHDGYAQSSSGKLSPEQQASLSQLSATAERIENQMRAAANAVFEKYRSECVAQYRTAITSVVKDVAQSHHLSVVLQSDDSVLFSDSTVDLTAEVIAAVNAHTPTVAAVPMPTLPAPPQLPATGSQQTMPTTAP